MRRLGTITSLLAALGLAATACGGGGSTSGGSNEPIKLGLITSLTGNYTPLGTNDKKGAELAVKEINSSGGLLGGRKIQLVTKNDKTQPNQSVIAFNELVGEDVAGVIGSSFSNSALATIPIAQRQQIPYISTAASDEQVNPVREYAFMTPPTAGVVAEQLLAYFESQGMTKMAVAYDSQSAFAMTGWRKMQEMAGQYGIEFVVQEEFQTTTSDFSSVFTAVRGSGAQGLMVWATGAPAVIITKQFASAGVDMPLVMSHAEASTLYTEPAGKAAEGVIVASSVATVGPHLPESELKKTVMDMAKAFQEKHGYYPPQFAFDGYGAVKLFAAAIEKAGSTEPDAIQQALEGLTLLTPEGEYHYTAQDHAGLDSDDVAIAEVTDGDFVPTEWSQQQLEQTLGG